MISSPADELFERSPRNPILTVKDLPYPATAIFNPGAVQVGAETLLLARVEDLRGISQLHVARSVNGVTDWRFDPAPLLEPEPGDHPEEGWGCEDPRLSRLPERDEWAIAYTAYSRRGPMGRVAGGPRLHAGRLLRHLGRAVRRSLRRRGLRRGRPDAVGLRERPAVRR